MHQGMVTGMDRLSASEVTSVMISWKDSSFGHFVEKEKAFFIEGHPNVVAYLHIQVYKHQAGQPCG